MKKLFAALILLLLIGQITYLQTRYIYNPIDQSLAQWQVPCHASTPTKTQVIAHPRCPLTPTSVASVTAIRLQY
ncbi:hypothetical protein [Reichenbachiella sp. 5M10]|uniref:hypothetical protein n=1 Tax=Reichenbachiella sp. 5M10 TaxID=1889772 RepID=UPI00117B892D|nr:hypothetical protein [Reichenbachiella sp. 5M10]